jgi:thiamine biosynthesis lipoprotein
METLRLARHAMATRFEIVLPGQNAVSLRAAGEEALDEIERLEAKLSLFRSSSEIAHINARAAYEPVQVTPAVFGLLQHAQLLTEQTLGTFDITIAPLVRCWGFMGGPGHVPAAADLAAAREKVGMHLVHLDPSNFTVRFDREGVMIDLGAIGKGYAIDCAVELLREAGVANALVHGGTSSVYAMGHPPEGDAWKIELTSPRNADNAVQYRDESNTGNRSESPQPSERRGPFAVVSLSDNSLAVSAVWGKCFQTQGKSFGHIIDPRTGEPAKNGVMSAVILPSATEADALSTALLTLGPSGNDRIASLRSEIRTLVIAEANGSFEFRSQGISVGSLI